MLQPKLANALLIILLAIPFPALFCDMYIYNGVWALYNWIVRIVAFLFQCVQNVYFIAEWHFLSLLSHYPNYTFWIARNQVQNITRNSTNYRAICQ